MLDDQEYVDIAELCKRLGGSKPLSRSTIYRGVAAGTIPPPIRITVGVLRWDWNVIRKMIAEKAANQSERNSRAA